MKKDVRSNFVFILGLILLLSIGFVAAQQGAGGGQGPWTDLSEWINKGFDAIQPVLNVLLGDKAPSSFDKNISTSSEYLARIMFFFVVFSLIYLAISRMPFLEDNDAIKWVLTIAVTILATRWLAGSMGGTLVRTLLLPYDTLGLSLAAFLPLIIYFVFLDIGFIGKENRVIRRGGWIFFLVIFVFLWITRAPEIVTDASNYAGMIYPVSAGICFLFFLLDGTIQRQLYKIRLSKNKTASAQNLLDHLETKKEQLENSLEDAVTKGNDDKAKRAKKRLLKLDKKILKYETKF